MGTFRGSGPSVVLLTSLSILLFVGGCSSDKKKKRSTPTATSVVGTATATRPPTVTSAPGEPTATATSGVEATATPTSIAATATRTNTGAPATATPTQAGGATATATATVAPTATATGAPAPGIASKSSSIALSPDQAIVVMVNPEDDSISIFDTATNTRTAKVKTGDEPSAVVIAPDNTTAFVANRAAGTVVKVSNLKSANPIVSDPLTVGSEPTGLALTPMGRDLFVAEFAEGAVTAIDVGSAVTSVGEIDAVITVPDHPRAIAVTNDGDGDDEDETLIVADFYGVPNEGVSGCPNDTPEACDIGRLGIVWFFSTDEEYEGLGSIFFDPIDSGFAPSTAPPGSPTVMTSPNQFYATAVNGEKVYVTSVSASPQGPINFQSNVFPVVYVGDFSTHEQDEVATANIARLVRDAIPDGGGTDSFFLQEIVDLDFVAGSTAAWLVSRAADVAQRVVYDPTSGEPSATAPQVDLNANVGAGACQNPTGIVTSSVLGKAYVNCWITRRLAVVDLAGMTLQTTVQSADLPTPGMNADNVRLGARFYFTGRTRWSDEGEGYSSCGSCHPDGLSDGITHAFGTGPRQTTSMDGSFSHGPGGQKQRLFNWTAVNDEVHDFERNTRANSGGLGAITTAPGGAPCMVAEETRVNIDAPPANFGQLGVPVKEIQDTTADICVKDWDKIEAFVKTIRPPRGVFNDPESVLRGEILFDEGKCSTCHGGAGWTASRRFWVPSSPNNAALMDPLTNPFLAPTDDSFWPMNAAQIAPQPAAAEDPPMAVGPNQVACGLRNVGTFGIPGDATATNLIEVKVDGTRAQGRGGFNVPALYGLSVGAPYFHHGQALTLNDVFSEEWQAHYQAANPEFELDDPGKIQDLVNFLLTIDSRTREKAIPAGFDGCPIVFPPGEVFHADLDGQQEVPEPVETDATGEAVFFLSGDEQLISYVLDVDGIDPSQILQAHIHAPAPAGVNANVVLFLARGGFSSPLFGQVGPSDFIPDVNAGLGTYAAFLQALRTGNTYANVHTSSHPGGEIRGQIHPPAFTADLTGNQEVPPVETTANGEALYFTSPDGTSVSFVLNTFLLPPTNILFAHIHAAPVGVNGDVVIVLSPEAFASPLLGRFTGDDIQPNSAGIDTLTELLAAMEEGNTYTNVHSEAHVSGEIRGQNAPVE